jgi:hypothetical protein
MICVKGGWQFLIDMTAQDRICRLNQLQFGVPTVQQFLSEIQCVFHARQRHCYNDVPTLSRYLRGLIRTSSRLTGRPQS